MPTQGGWRGAARVVYKSETSPDLRDPASPPAAAAAAADHRGARTLLFASSIGTVIEWYDFFLFASAAALVFDKVFFPRVESSKGVLLGLMTYGVGFVTRPLGGVVFGVMGDRVGRRRALVASLLLMGVSTTAVGLLPGYETIGLLAPGLLVLLRLLQGLAVGGEVGGAVLLVAESLGAKRRGYFTAWPQIGGPAGNLAAAGVLALLSGSLPDAVFVTRGWRVAFLLSGFLVALGVYMRTRVEESPLFRAYAARRVAGATTLPSIGRTLRLHGRAVLGVLLIKAGENALFYVFTTFLVVYLTRVLHRPRALALTATLVGAAVEIAAIFGAGILSDRIGRRPVTAMGLLGAGAFAFILFPAIRSVDRATVFLAVAVAGVCHAFIVGGMSAFFVELFPTSARYTGFSSGYQLASVISGAVAPIIGVALLERFHATWPVSLYAAAMTIPALAALVALPETRGTDLARVE